MKREESKIYLKEKGEIGYRSTEENERTQERGETKRITDRGGERRTDRRGE